MVRLHISIVASFTDAWIETEGNSPIVRNAASHLLQMRGLKRACCLVNSDAPKSHLLQMRGLKQQHVLGCASSIRVASFTDAWIETRYPVVTIVPNGRIFYRCVD